MRKRLTNKWSMYNSILSLLNSNKEAWQSVSAPIEIIGTYEALLAEIAIYHQFTRENNKGITTQKAVWQ